MRAREAAVRALIAATLAVALVYEFVRTADLVDVSPLAHVVDYASYFTTLANTLAMTTLGIGTVIAVRADSDPAWYGRLMTATIAYAMTTCAVYNLALRAFSTAPDSWANEMLHVVGPLSLIVLWGAQRRGHMPSWRSIRGILGIPLAWLFYTMLRGMFSGWYPYEFLDPTQPGGVAFVICCVCLVSGLIVGFALAAVAVARWRASRIVEMQSDGSEELVGARRSLGTENLPTAGGAQQQRRRRADVVGRSILLARGDIPLGSRHVRHKPSELRHGPPSRGAGRAERRCVEHEIHTRVNARRCARVPVRFFRPLSR